ncbi:putative transcription factor bZIP family [Arabidopsis thaliana]
MIAALVNVSKESFFSFSSFLLSLFSPLIAEENTERERFTSPFQKIKMGGGGDTTDTNMMQRVNSSSGTSSSSIPKHNLHLNPALIRSHHHFRHPFTGAPPPPIPPISPYSQIPATLQPRHSRSMSQPSSFFSFDSLPPLNPSAPSVSVSVEEKTGAGFSPSLPPSPFTMCHSSSSRNAGDGENLPPRKSHRRSNSDVTFGFSSMMSQNQKSPPLSSLERSISGEDTSDWSNLVKKEPREGFYKGRKPEVEAAMDDVFTAYMNLDNIDVLNSFGGEDGKNGNENVEEMESSRGSGTKKTNGGSSSDSEGDSSASGNVKVALSSSSSGVKRRAGGDIAPTGRHYRSVSMDSCFMGKLNFGDESSLKLPPSSSAKVSPTNSGEGNSSAYSVEFGNSEFTAAEMKKIAADEKLAEIVMADPKRVKRILANRVSAARSKERKTRYMAELEHKVQTLQTEATTLSAQLTHLQRDSMGLTNQNSELKFRLQAMEQQAQLRDALSEKLNEEVQRLKLVIGEPNRRQSGSSSSESKMSLNPEMFQQLSISQLQHQQMQHSNQCSTMKAKHTSND